MSRLLAYDTIDVSSLTCIRDVLWQKGVVLWTNFHPSRFFCGLFYSLFFIVHGMLRATKHSSPSIIIDFATRNQNDVISENRQSFVTLIKIHL